MEGGSIEPFDSEEEEDRKRQDAEEKQRKLSQRLGGILFFPMEQMGILRTNCIE